MNTQNKAATYVDIFYAITIIIAFSVSYYVSNHVLYFTLLVLILSILLDWKSAEVTLIRNHPIFLFSDLISVYNYISLLLALTFQKSSTEPFSRLIWVHYFLVFVIYLGWNLTLLLVEKSDETTKRFFIGFSIAECIGTIIPLVMLVDSLNHLMSNILGIDINNYGEFLIILLSSYHLIIIIAFVYITYYSSARKKDTITKLITS